MKLEIEEFLKQEFMRWDGTSWNDAGEHWSNLSE